MRGYEHHEGNHQSSDVCSRREVLAADSTVRNMAGL